jgi:hypothetical protein
LVLLRKVCYETLELLRQLGAIKHGNIPQNAGDEESVAKGDGSQAPGNLLERLWDHKTWHKLEIARPGGRHGTRWAAEVTNAPNAKRCA